MFMKGCLHGELFGLDPAIFLGIVLVDKLDGEDRIIGMERRCFLDARLLSAVVEPEERVCGQVLCTMHMRRSLSFLTPV
jgi:hypothetical protein